MQAVQTSFFKQSKLLGEIFLLKEEKILPSAIFHRAATVDPRYKKFLHNQPFFSEIEVSIKFDLNSLKSYFTKKK